MAVIGSIKANIGHTKAASGVAGLIKATMAVHTQVLPPTTGCEQPHSLLTGPKPALRVSREAEIWPANNPLRASVSGMGFGGINAHIVLEGVVTERRLELSSGERTFVRSGQDAEIFLLSAQTPDALAQKVETLLVLAGRLSRAELADLADILQKKLDAPAIRVAVIASRPMELVKQLQTLKSWLQIGVTSRLQFPGRNFSRLGPVIAAHCFFISRPGLAHASRWRDLEAPIRVGARVVREAALPAGGRPRFHAVMQPAVVTASLAALKVLRDCGITASAAVGHSLGEITALHWAGGFSAETLLRIARVRGQATAELGNPTGAMLSIAAQWWKVQALLDDQPLTVVGFQFAAPDCGCWRHCRRKPTGPACSRPGLAGNVVACAHAFTHPWWRQRCPCWPNNSRAKHFPG